jgi:hypothetical protein
VLLVQPWPLGHAVVQLPQCVMSFVRSTQAPEHAVWPAWHEVPHVPFEHTWPVVQALPHVPQLAGSDVTSAQVAAAPVPHAVRPVAQPHTPLLHTWPLAQALLQLPQLALSVLVSVHAAPHKVCPTVVQLHMPVPQLEPPGHTLPHVPQLALSVVVSTHVAPHDWLGAVQAEPPLPAVLTPLPPLPAVLPTPPLPEVFAEPPLLVPSPALPPLVELSPEPPPLLESSPAAGMLVLPDENDPHEAIKAPSEAVKPTATATETRERIFFICGISSS